MLLGWAKLGLGLVGFFVLFLNTTTPITTMAMTIMAATTMTGVPHVGSDLDAVASGTVPAVGELVGTVPAVGELVGTVVGETVGMMVAEGDEDGEVEVTKASFVVIWFDWYLMVPAVMNNGVAMLSST